MGSKENVILCVFLAVVLLIPSQVLAARGLAEISNTSTKSKENKKTNGAEVKYGYVYPPPTGGYYRPPTGGYVKPPPTGYGCNYGCCGYYYGGGCRCCTYAGEKADADVHAEPQN